MEPKTSRKIVSRGAYIQAQGKRAGLNMLGLCLLLAAVGVGLVAIIAVFFLVAFTSPSSYIEDGPLKAQDLLGGAVMVLINVGIAHLCGKFGMKSLDHAHQIDPGVPRSLANSDLPARQSPVRASSEPTQAQETVLLCAAQGHETPPEQLVRAVEGQEQP